MSMWRILCLIGFPMKMQGLDEGGSPPKKLSFTRRFSKNSQLEYQKAKLFLREVADERLYKQFSFFGTQAELVFLVCEVDAEDLEDATSKSAHPIEWVCDNLAFNSQYPILIHQTQIQDLTKPEDVMFYPAPFQPPKFRSFIRGNVKAADEVVFSSPPECFDERDFASLRWYHKALAAPYEIDQFTFFWISLEVLSKNFDTSVSAGYISRCGHEIPSCPTCGESTEREINGRSIKKFLTTYLGLSNSEASALWQYRQIFHGNNKLTEEKTKDMHSNVTLLQAAVSKGIKIRFGLSDEDLPIVDKSCFTAQNGFGIGIQSNPK